MGLPVQLQQLPQPPLLPLRPLQENADGSTTTTKLPPGLKDYVERVFQTVESAPHLRETVEHMLTKMIKICSSNGTLWTIDWDTEPLTTELKALVEQQHVKQSPPRPSAAAAALAQSSPAAPDLPPPAMDYWAAAPHRPAAPAYRRQGTPPFANRGARDARDRTPPLGPGASHSLPPPASHTASGAAPGYSPYMQPSYFAEPSPASAAPPAPEPARPDMGDFMAFDPPSSRKKVVRTPSPVCVVLAPKTVLRGRIHRGETGGGDPAVRQG